MSSPHPVCPRCRMETIRLVMNGRACDWCSTRKQPLTRTEWNRISARLDKRAAEKAEADASRMHHRDCKVCGAGYTVTPTSKRSTCSKDCESQAQAVQRR